MALTHTNSVFRFPESKREVRERELLESKQSSRFVCLYVYMYLYVCVCMYVCMCVCVCTICMHAVCTICMHACLLMFISTTCYLLTLDTRTHNLLHLHVLSLTHSAIPVDIHTYTVFRRMEQRSRANELRRKYSECLYAYVCV